MEEALSDLVLGGGVAEVGVTPRHTQVEVVEVVVGIECEGQGQDDNRRLKSAFYQVLSRPLML